MSPSPIKTGFVGLSTKGWASAALGPSLLNSPNYSLVAVSTSSEESAKASAEVQSKIVGHPVKAYHGSTTAIANDPDIQFVAVSVRAPLHKQSLLPVIEAGKDFFIEWPAGVNIEETTEFARLSKEKGLRTIVGLQGRQSATAKKIKEIIDSGKIGKVLSSSIIALTPRHINIWAPDTTEGSAYALDPAKGASIIDIVGGHHLDLFTYVLGDFASISATTAQCYPTASIVDKDGKPTGKTVPNLAPDQFAYSGILKSGVLVNAIWRSGFKSTPGRDAFVWVIDGEEGSIRLTDDAFLHLRVPKVYLDGEPVEIHSSGLYDFVSSAWEEYAKGESGAYATIDDAVKLRRLLEAIKQSAREGRRIDL